MSIVIWSADGRSGRYIESGSSRASVPFSTCCSSTVSTSEWPTLPVRWCMSTVAGTPVRVSPSAPTSTRLAGAPHADDHRTQRLGLEQRSHDIRRLLQPPRPPRRTALQPRSCRPGTLPPRSSRCRPADSGWCREDPRCMRRSTSSLRRSRQTPTAPCSSLLNAICALRRREGRRISVIVSVPDRGARHPVRRATPRRCRPTARASRPAARANRPATPSARSGSPSA